MWLWSQILVAGGVLGSFYALVALGFSLIFGVTRAFNLAHGEFIILSGYLSYFLWKLWHLPFYWTIPVCLVTMPGAAFLLQQFLRRVRPPLEMNSLVATFGLALVLQNLMLTLFSADYRLLRPDAFPLLTLAGGKLIITDKQFALLAFSLTATILLHLLLRHTFVGKALRATIQDREAAELAGINVRRMGWLAFAFGGGLIGLAGPLYGQTMYLYPAGGVEATFIAVTITIFAGVGRTRSLLLGGWLLGWGETAAALGWGGSWKELVSALLLIMLLIIRPQGLAMTRGQ